GAGIREGGAGVRDWPATIVQREMSCPPVSTGPNPWRRWPGPVRRGNAGPQVELGSATPATKRRASALYAIVVYRGLRRTRGPSLAPQPGSFGWANRSGHNRPVLQPAPQVGGQFSRRGIPLGRFLPQALEANRFQVAGNGRIEAP